MTPRQGALLFLAGLSGCALLHPQNIGAPPPAAAPAPAAVEPSREPAGLLDFVATAPSGQSRTFEDPALGAVRVTAGRQYYSAAAVFCRHFLEARLAGEAARATETRAVCRQEGGWRLDPIGTTGAVRSDR